VLPAASTRQGDQIDGSGSLSRPSGRAITTSRFYRIASWLEAQRSRPPSRGRRRAPLSTDPSTGRGRSAAGRRRSDEGIRGQEGQPLVCRDLRGGRPHHRQGEAPLARRRSSPTGRRTARVSASERTGGSQRRGARPDRRRVPHQPVAAREAAGTCGEHVRRLPTQRRESHPACDRPNWTAPASRPPPRDVLRPATAPSGRASAAGAQDRV
jgi:hypothetical protein